MRFQVFLLDVASRRPREPEIDAEQGRRLLQEELSRDVYHKPGSVLQMLWEKFISQFNMPEAGITGLNLSWLLVAVVVIALAAVILSILGSREHRRNAIVSSAPQNAPVFDDQRTAVQYLAAVHNALNHEDFTTAFLEQFRHVIKQAETFKVLQITPGLTAIEASDSLIKAYPHFHEDLLWAAQLFNALRYGHLRGDKASFQRLANLDQSIEQTTGETAGMTS